MPQHPITPVPLDMMLHAAIDNYLEDEKQDKRHWVTAFLPRGVARFGRMANSPGEATHNMLGALRTKPPLDCFVAYVEGIKGHFVSRGFTAQSRSTAHKAVCGPQHGGGLMDNAMTHHSKSMEVRACLLPHLSLKHS